MIKQKYHTEDKFRYQEYLQLDGSTLILKDGVKFPIREIVRELNEHDYLVNSMTSQFWSVIMAQGGEVRVPADTMKSSTKDSVMERNEDIETNEIIFLAR